MEPRDAESLPDGHEDFARAMLDAMAFTALRYTNDGDITQHCGEEDASDVEAALADDDAASLRADAEGFWAEHGGVIGPERASLAGHDFHLTRNGHGAGFWDGDWPEPLASTLTEASRPYGTCELLWDVNADRAELLS